MEQEPVSSRSALKSPLMDNKLLVDVVMLPTEEKYFDSPVLWYAGEAWKLQFFDKFASAANKASGYKPQHLYLTSSEEIKEDDWMIREWYPPTGSFRRDVYQYKPYMKSPSHRRIEASTDPSLGLPLIPQKWIEEVYVPAQGKVKQVYIQTHNLLPHKHKEKDSWNLAIEKKELADLEKRIQHAFDMAYWGEYNTLKSNLITEPLLHNGEVIILPIKDSWNREEIKALHKAYLNDDMSDVGLFDEWFDKNY